METRHSVTKVVKEAFFFFSQLFLRVLLSLMNLK